MTRGDRTGDETRKDGSLDGGDPRGALDDVGASGVPSFRFSPSKLPDDEAFEAWRQIMGRMFRIDRASSVDGLPRGGVSSFLVGNIMANRSVFNAQTLSRDRGRIASTPDHMVLQLYLSGGFSGIIGGRSVRIACGQIAICDLRHTLKVEAMTRIRLGCRSREPFSMV